MKILYSGVKNNSYNRPGAKGETFEHHNFYASLSRYPGAEVTYAPFDRILEAGRKKFNDEILDIAKREKPDLFFAFMYSDELDPGMLEELKKLTKTAAWFADDSWRFWNYSRKWARHFNWAVTTYSYMPALYKKEGQPNVIRSQWAADIDTYKPAPQDIMESSPSVVFVGGWSKPRARMIGELRRAGIEVHVFGGGWPGARRAGEEEMIGLFSRAKINLGLNPSPAYFNLNSLGRLFLRPSANKIVPDLDLVSNVKSWIARGVPQVKARHFQIPACGGFTMTSMADDLDLFYEPGREIVIYEDMPDMVEKIRHYLSHEDERKAIAEAGYKRTIKDHTYPRRFEEIFKIIGLGE